MPNVNPIPSVEDAEREVNAVTDVALAVFRLNGVLLQWGDRLVAPLGLTSARWQMLGALALSATPLTAPQVGRAMGVTRQGALKQLGVLEQLGLVRLLPNPAHRRSPLYDLTPEGRRRYEQADALWRAQAAELAARVPAAQAACAARVLHALEQELKTHPLNLEDES